jgi:hypothetical protein
LEWRTLVGTPKDYWIQYPDGANPCTETSPIHGTQDKPAQCHVRSDLAGQPLPYTYSISDVDPTQIIKPLGVTPCNGCSYAIGTPTGLATSVDKGPTPGPVPPPGPAKAFVSVPGLIYLSCAANTKTFVADPGSAKTGDVQSVTWYPEAPAPPTDWLVTFKPPTGSQQPLCAGNPNPTQFTSASPGCNLNLPGASGTYTYSVSSPSSACAESDGNTITIGP